jgi:hypothetical protein
MRRAVRAAPARDAQDILKRPQIIQLTIVTSVAASLLSCSGGNPPTRYCVDQNQTVADERDCENSTPGHHWYYGGPSGYVPSGTRISGGSTEVPSQGFTTPSGTVRGGIGASGEAVSSGAHAATGGEGGAGE